MCYCIEKINESFREKYQADSAFLQHPGWSEIRITPITRKLERSKHSRYKRVDWNYCPFCGEHK